MIIKLHDISVFYINMDDAVDRRVEMEKLLHKRRFKNVTRVKGPKKQHPWHGCASGHLAAMQNRKPPFIVLEDDCRLKTDVGLVDVPNDADCLYLGIANRGTTDDVKFFRHGHSDQIVRLYDMLSAHAILFLSEAYYRDCVKIAQECVDHGEKALDVAYAKNMPYWKVYALANPLFHQAECCLKTNVRFKTDQQYIDDSLA